MASPYFGGGDSVPGGLLPAGFMQAATLPGQYLSQAMQQAGNSIADGLAKYDQGKKEMDYLHAQRDAAVQSLQSLPQDFLTKYATPQQVEQISALAPQMATGGRSQLMSGLLKAQTIRNDILANYQRDATNIAMEKERMALDLAKQDQADQAHAIDVVRGIDGKVAEYAPPSEVRLGVPFESTVTMRDKTPKEISAEALQKWRGRNIEHLRTALQFSGVDTDPVNTTPVPGGTAITHGNNMAIVADPEQKIAARTSEEQQKLRETSSKYFNEISNSDLGKDMDELAGTYRTLQRISTEAAAGRSEKNTAYDLASAYIAATVPGFKRMNPAQQQEALKSPALSDEIVGYFKKKITGVMSPSKAKLWADAGMTKIGDWRDRAKVQITDRRRSLAQQGFDEKQIESMLPDFESYFQPPPPAAPQAQLVPSQLGSFFQQNPSINSTPVIVNGVVKTAYRKGFEPQK